MRTSVDRYLDPDGLDHVVWYILYAFVVGRGYNQYGEAAGYHFSSYVVLPYGDQMYCNTSSL
jgi:hypothetical protein